MLTITKLRGAEYLISSVADGVEDYFMGVGEAPGVWQGRWAESLGLSGVVEADQLRAVVEGRHLVTGVPLMSGLKEREVKAYDLTFSAPKSVSVLWAFGDQETTAEVSIAVSSAATRALTFLESRAAVTRRQINGIRRQVGTEGFAVAAFTHRTSRDGDPQLHVHCLVPNIAERDDGKHVAIDGGPMHTWLKAAGTMFQADLQRQLVDRLGVTWGPERNGTRELVGFEPGQLRAFSKRTTAIETALEAGPEVFTAKERMKADDAASLRTRSKKDRNLTPDVLRERWADEAAAVGLPTGTRLVRTLRHETTRSPLVDRAALLDTLADPDVGVCATRARFRHAHVIERVGALASGRWTIDEIESTAGEFLASHHVVALAVGKDGAGRRRPQEWSTVEHRRLEDRVLVSLEVLRQRTDFGCQDELIAAGLAANSFLGDDQRAAVEALCGQAGSLRVVLAAAGHGKTALTTTAAEISTAAGRPVLALATTNKAVAELRGAGLEASTIARWRTTGAGLPAGAVVIIDEVSQVSTRDAAAVLDAVLASPRATMWCLGDEDQGRSIAPGGLAAELARLADRDEVTAAELTVNRRQQHPAERAALADYRAGDLEASQRTRAEHGWEHTATTPGEVREALAEAAVADIDVHGTEHVVVLAVSHADCEDLADRIRARLKAAGVIHGHEVEGPGWATTSRAYAAGDRILLHTAVRLDGERVPGGSTATVTRADRHGLALAFDDGRTGLLPAEIVLGRRPDGTPKVSHAWARTVDGAQGGTWEQAHVLATPNVDRHTLYVAQSRGRQPTHTWNTPAGINVEAHGNVVVDPRTPDEQILAAASRVPEHRFAAHDDPHILDRQLTTERDGHRAALAAGPRDASISHRQAAARVVRVEQEAKELRDRIRRIDAHLGELGGLRQLRGSTRNTRRALHRSRDDATTRLDANADQLEPARTDLDRAAGLVRRRAEWVEANRWRHGEILRLDHQLGLHWTRAVLDAIEVGEPLAHGLGRVRDASRFLATTPGADPSNAAAVADALAQARAERIQRLADGDEPPRHLVNLLGPVPPEPAVKDTWLALADRIEAGLDNDRSQPGLGRPQELLSAARQLADPIGPDRPERWTSTLREAAALQAAIEQQRSLSRDVGLSR